YDGLGSSGDCTGPLRVVVALVPVVLPLEGLEVVEAVTTAPGNRHDVIDLPTEAPERAVVAPLHEGVAGVLPPDGRVMTGYRLALAPDGVDRRGVEGPARPIRVGLYRLSCSPMRRKRSSLVFDISDF